ncbi:5806_t:CDS:2, partial [Funneliformis mosseae]
INLTSSRPPSVQRINLIGSRPPSASSLQKSNLTSSSPSPLASLSQKIKLTTSLDYLTSFSSFPSAFSASSKPFSASSTQKPSINLEKLKDIRGSDDIDLSEDNYQNLAKELSDLHMKYNQLE